jgi:hypothetical protein
MNTKSNRLGLEKSPYLKQHAMNPVDWYPWGEEAFAKAAAEDKPIFLSIGYSTCHWCHVMEHESFEDPAVAELMNKAFVNVKVDREERPDVDHVYMTVCMMMNRRGGWPLTVMMTPDKRPFFAATYIPRESRFQMTGMLELIPHVEKLWKENRAKLFETADVVVEHLQKITPAAGIEPDKATLDKAVEQLAEAYDADQGGFGGAPKFPSPHNILFLLRRHAATGDAKCLEMAEKTLTAMRLGGMYDHIGFGFHRYSTDAEWLLPHFEKMLYDQAMLAMAYTEAYQITENEFYMSVAEEIFEYVLRDMTAPEGVFYSAEDADSEGEEGKFYVWTEAEIRPLLPKDRAELAVAVFNIVPEGNFADESTGERNGANIPHMKETPEALAARFDLTPAELVSSIAEIRETLFNEREKRERPLRDDKHLTDWNGLMIAAMAKAAAAFDRPDLADAATRAADFILTHMRPEGRLLHRRCEGENQDHGFLDDYAFMIWGLVELYQATFRAEYLKHGLMLTEDAIAWFWDDPAGGFVFAPLTGEKLPGRHKDTADGAAPSGNSIMMLNLLRLARLTGKSEYEEKAAALYRAFSGNVTMSPANYNMLLCAAEFALGPAHEAVVVGDFMEDDTQTLISALHVNYLPRAVLLLKDEASADLAPFIAEMQQKDGAATAYVCEGFSCHAPTNDVAEMLEFLGVKA